MTPRRTLIAMLVAISVGLLVGRAAAYASEDEPKKFVVLGSAILLGHPELNRQPQLPVRMRKALDPQGAWHMQATGNGGGMAFLCKVPVALEKARQRGETALKDVQLVLLTRVPTEGEIALCVKHGRTISTTQLALYTGGLNKPLGGAFTVTAEEIVTPEARKAIKYLYENRRTLFGEPPLSMHFEPLP